MDIRKYISDNEPTVIMMIGLSGSGKSTVAKEIKEQVGERVTILSSDELRQSLFGDVNDQTHNEEVFSYIKKHTRSVLESDSNQVCVVDATNLSVKDRSWLFCQCGTNKKGRKIAVLLPTIYDECLTRNSQRQRVVPMFVLERQIRKFEIPFYEEGWNNILIWNVEDEFSINKPYAFNALMYRMSKFNQNNPHHIFNLYLHSKAISFFYDKNNFMREVAFLHDCKKPYVETKDKNGISHYYNHANVSAYYVLTHPWLIKDKENFLDILFYINYHMIWHSVQSKKSYQKYLKLFGKEKAEKISQFVEYDKLSSNKLIFNIKNNNTYEKKEDYYIGRNKLGQVFYIDLEDLSKIINYGWCYKDPKKNDFRLITCDENGKMLFMHRIIMDENNPQFSIDHIGHKQFDNRKRFLRKCSQWDNSKNTSLSKNNSSGFNGVSYISKLKKYRAYINNKYKQIYIGIFDTAEEANEARVNYEKKLYKDFSPVISDKIASGTERK